MIKIEVAYARPDQQFLLSLEVAAGTTVIEAIKASGILQRCAEIEPETQAIGIFSKPCKPDQILQPGDRVEIYRPLIADPKEVRRTRHEASKSKKTAPTPN